MLIPKSLQFYCILVLQIRYEKLNDHKICYPVKSMKVNDICRSRMLFTFDRLILMYLSCDLIFSLPSSSLFLFARESHFFKINPSGKINRI